MNFTTPFGRRGGGGTGFHQSLAYTWTVTAGGGRRVEGRGDAGARGHAPLGSAGEDGHPGERAAGLVRRQRAVARVPGRRAALPQGGRRQHPAVVRLTLAAALHNHPDRRRALMHHHPFVMVRVHTVSRTLLPHHRLAHCVPSPSLPLSLPLCLSLTLPRDSLTGTRATWRP